MGFGAIIIGDEIIRGKRQDKHFSTLVEILKKRGLTLDWSLYIGDNRPRLIDTLKHSFATEDVVFSFGGIGATPDDHTRQSAAAAAGVPLQLHPDAEREIRARFAETKTEVTAQRLELGTYPAGSRIIPNPYNRIPGFSYGDHHFVPGFPQMAWPMVEWVLDTYYADRFHLLDETEEAILVWDGMEGTLIPLMQRIESEFSGTTVFSLPSLGDAETRRHIELGVRGKPAAVASAMQIIRREVPALGFAFSEK
ncbi:MAG: competence/damage-inducible protein A [Rhodocyclaceae bacterium]|nr:MAG: competence/damage-inducible protein A [Rhodocyclaceae bacterium]